MRTPTIEKMGLTTVVCTLQYTHHVTNGLEVGGAVVGRRGRVGGEVRVEGEAVGNLVQGHLKRDER